MEKKRPWHWVLAGFMVLAAAIAVIWAVGSQEKFPSMQMNSIVPAYNDYMDMHPVENITISSAHKADIQIGHLYIDNTYKTLPLSNAVTLEITRAGYDGAILQHNYTNGDQYINIIASTDDIGLGEMLSSGRNPTIGDQEFSKYAVRLAGKAEVDYILFYNNLSTESGLTYQYYTIRDNRITGCADRANELFFTYHGILYYVGTNIRLDEIQAQDLQETILGLGISPQPTA